LSDEDRPAAGSRGPTAADGPAPPSSAARSLPPARRPEAGGLLARARPLVAAVAGLALGAACGQWLISQMAVRLRPAQAQAAAPFEAAPLAASASAAEGSTEDGGGRPATTEAVNAPADAEGPAGEPTPDAAFEDARRGAPAVAEPARRKANGARPPATAGGTGRGAETAGPSGREAGARFMRRGGGRCALSLSAHSLSLRAGGSGAVTAAVDELAGRGGLTASTKDWPDIAVFSESAGGRGRYTIISVSKRPGSYAVTFKSPCGAKTLPVVVR